VSARIATHRDAAGEPQVALVHYRRGAAHAQRVSALDRGAVLLRRALRLLGELPDGSERDELELELNLELGVPLVALEGYAGEGATAGYQRARELCERLGRPVAAPVLRGLALGAISRAELNEAAGLASELLTAEDAVGDRMLQVEGHYLLGVTAFWWADFAAARSHLEQAIERTTPRPRRRCFGNVHMAWNPSDEVTTVIVTFVGVTEPDPEFGLTVPIDPDEGAALDDKCGIDR
jgi:hypothetical protein